MLVIFSLIFVVDTKIVFSYKFGSPLRKELSIKLFPKILAPDIPDRVIQILLCILPCLHFYCQ